MEKDRSSKIIAVIALLIAVMGVSVGFAAFSNTLTIKPSAEVKTRGDLFNIDFSSSDTVFAAEDVPGTAEITNGATLTGEQLPTASNAHIDNSADPVITNLHAVFTAPGQKVTYRFAAANVGQIDGFLRRVEFKNVTGQSEKKICKAKPVAEGQNPASAASVADACEQISITIKVGTSDELADDNVDFKNHALTVGAFEAIVVTIEYADTEGVQPADGDFDVEFGDIMLTYESVDNNAA